MGKRGIILPAT